MNKEEKTWGDFFLGFVLGCVFTGAAFASVAPARTSSLGWCVFFSIVAAALFVGAIMDALNVLANGGDGDEMFLSSFDPDMIAAEKRHFFEELGRANMQKGGADGG